MATKKIAKEKASSLQDKLRKEGYKMPHGYEISVRKKAAKKKK